jgi:hypothetical protein
VNRHDLAALAMTGRPCPSEPKLTIVAEPDASPEELRWFEASCALGELARCDDCSDRTAGTVYHALPESLPWLYGGIGELKAASSTFTEAAYEADGTAVDFPGDPFIEEAAWNGHQS